MIFLRKKSKTMGYLYIFATVFFTVYGQIILKWRMNTLSVFPENATLELSDKFIYVFKLLLDPWILSGFLAAFVASLFWILAMSKFEISYAYPFMSSAFIFVLIISYFFLSETMSIEKVIGMGFIVLGIIISSRSL